MTKIYSFRSLKELTELANVLAGIYKGNNTLYKDPVTATYYLVLSISSHTPEEFNKISNIISEYGKAERTTYASQITMKNIMKLLLRIKHYKSCLSCKGQIIKHNI